jgi:hypothetical protein
MVFVGEVATLDAYGLALSADHTRDRVRARARHGIVCLMGFLNVDLLEMLS